MGHAACLTKLGLIAARSSEKSDSCGFEVESSFLDGSDVSRMRELMRKYRDLPMDLADAALVRVAEREKLRRIFTLDHRDFAIYRPSRLGRFLIIP